MNAVSITLLVVTALLIAYSLFSLYLVVYAWDSEEAQAAAAAPAAPAPPSVSFTVLLPARHEHKVIYETVCKIAAARYPPELLEVIVVCHADDGETASEARRAAEAAGPGGRGPRVRVVTFEGGPVTKPRGLNVGLREARHDFVAVFDAEDDVSPDVFGVVNTTLLREGGSIVQVGVQLMNYQGRWFCLQNVLEYYYHFKSRLLYFAHVGMVPLGGNTLFMRRQMLERVGGWDENCLTEDADLGVRLSVLGERTRVIYDPRYVTREETPDTTVSLVRQRTRWHQGFLQVLAKRDWTRLSTAAQRALGVYVFTGPIVQAVLTLVAVPAIIGGLWIKTHPAVVVISYLPIYAILFHFLMTLVGARLFSLEYGIRLAPWHYAGLCVTFVPYHALMGLAAVRAILRQALGVRDWEKTRHVGAHRAARPKPRPETRRVPALVHGDEGELVREL